MDEQQKVSGIKRYLARTKSTLELEALADLAFESATDEVTIIGHSTDGAGASGVVNVPKYLLLQAIEEILSEGTTGRQFCKFVDRSHSLAPV